MPDADVLASVRNGGSRKVALALELIGMILRGQDDRIQALEAKP